MHVLVRILVSKLVNYDRDGYFVVAGLSRLFSSRKPTYNAVENATDDPSVLFFVAVGACCSEQPLVSKTEMIFWRRKNCRRVTDMHGKGLHHYQAHVIMGRGQR